MYIHDVMSIDLINIFLSNIKLIITCIVVLLNIFLKNYFFSFKSCIDKESLYELGCKENTCLFPI